MGVSFIVIVPLLTSCCGFSYVLGCGISVFDGFWHLLVNNCSRASCDFGVLLGEDEWMSSGTQSFRSPQYRVSLGDGGKCYILLSVKQTYLITLWPWAHNLTSLFPQLENGFTPKPKGCSKSSSMRKVYSNESLPQEIRKTSNRQPNLISKATRKKKDQKTLKLSRRKKNNEDINDKKRNK